MQPEPHKQPLEGHMLPQELHKQPPEDHKPDHMQPEPHKPQLEDRMLPQELHKQPPEDHKRGRKLDRSASQPEHSRSHFAEHNTLACSTEPLAADT